MNLSAAVMLFEENGVRPCQVEYDPDIARNNNPERYFKCVDPSVSVGDLVIVQTSTRHGFTVAKVVSIGYADVPVDFDSAIKWGWIAAKFDRDGFANILTSEANLVGKVAEANANKMRADLKNAMGLNTVSLADVFIKAPAALATPHGTAPKKEAPNA